MRRALLTLGFAASLSLFGCGDSSSSSDEPAADSAGDAATSGDVSGICEIASFPTAGGSGDMCFSFTDASETFASAFESALCDTFSGTYTQGGSCSTENVFDDTCVVSAGSGVEIQATFYEGFSEAEVTTFCAGAGASAAEL